MILLRKSKKVKKVPRPRMYRHKRDKYDSRDFMYSLLKPDIVFPTLPVSVDLRFNCSPVEDQGRFGLCTACSLAGNLEFLEIKDSPVSFVNLSRLFIYYNRRMVEHSVKSDGGAELRDGIKSLVAFGVCPEIEWPYIISKLKVKPYVRCYKSALAHKIASYYRLSSLSDMLACLASGFPFVFGFQVYSYFESIDMATTGILKMPVTGEEYLGSYAVCAVGYNHTSQMILVRNSWGSSWGVGGYFWMPYSYISHSQLASDFWSIRK